MTVYNKIMIIIRNLLRLSVCIILFFMYISVYNTYFSKYIIDYTMLLFGFLLTYSIFTLFGAKKEKECVAFMININNIHIHHWMYFSLFLLIALHFKANSFILGGLLGGICHGIQYNDWNSLRAIHC